MTTSKPKRTTKGAKKATSRKEALSPYVRERVLEAERTGELPAGSAEALEDAERSKKPRLVDG